MGCVRSFKRCRAYSPCAAFVVSTGKRLRGPGMAVPPPRASTVEIIAAIMRREGFFMKIKKSMLTLALALAVVCGITIGASASSTLQEIKAYLNSGITIKYNNEAQTMTDAGGNTVYPITYNGSTYLPVRAISNILGVGVDWDQATQTVLLGKTDTSNTSSPTGVDLLESFQPYSFTSEARQSWNEDITRYYEQVQKSAEKTMEIGGVTADHWALMFTGKYCKTPTVSGFYNIGGKYSTLTFQAYSDHDATLSVYGDNEKLLAEFSLVGSQVPQTCTVNVQGVTQLHFQMSTNPEGKVIAVSTYIFDANLT